MTPGEAARLAAVLAAIHAQAVADPHGYWLSYQATPRQFAEALHWEREAAAGRYHPAYV